MHNGSAWFLYSHGEGSIPSGPTRILVRPVLTLKTIRERGYSSVSELVRDAVRRVLYPELTENGFTPEFEEMVLESAKEPLGNDIVLETDEDIDRFFDGQSYNDRI